MVLPENHGKCFYKSFDLCSFRVHGVKIFPYLLVEWRPVFVVKQAHEIVKSFSQ